MRRNKTNWIVTTLMIAGALVAIIFPLYLTILIAVKSPQDMVPSAL